VARRLAAEGLGSLFLFATVIGSGIMAEHLSKGNDPVALLGNTLATGAMLFVLTTTLGPVSGAHMNPAVRLVAAFRREPPTGSPRRPASPTPPSPSRAAFPTPSPGSRRKTCRLSSPPS
jgi:hypothetical protein